MNREILFRGQKINSEEWVYGSLIETNQFIKHMPWLHSKFWIVTSSFGNGGWFNVRSRFHVNSKTVGQYIGLKDKNGVKIFECDVCKNDVYWDYPREIGLNYLNTVCSIDKDGSQYMFYMSTLDNIEIIGNIHQDQKAKTWTQK